MLFFICPIFYTIHTFLPSLLADEFYTPNELFYVRSHLPTPDIDPAAYELEVNPIPDRFDTSSTENYCRWMESASKERREC